MRTGELPLEVLGLLGPLLCWVEGTAGLRLPERWVGHRIEPDKRVKAWLVRELPTYSRDSIDEIQRLARRRRGGGTASWQFRSADPNTPAAMEPPPGYDLADAFHRLSERYFQWSGNELNVKDQRVEELHEVALRFPVRFLIRFRHARAVATGLLSAEEALELPVQMSRLHSTAQSIRAVIDRGLTEGHLHLWGVTSADESWADHLLRPISQGAISRFSTEHEDQKQHERLLVLSRCAVRMLALGLLHDRLAGTGDELPFDLVERLDRVYFAPTPKAERREREELRLMFLAELEKASSAGKRPLPSDEELAWLLALADPKAHFHWRQGRPSARPMVLRGQEIAGVRGRLRLIERLHFEVLRRLFELNPLTGGGPAESSGQPGNRWRFLHRVFYRYLVYCAHHWHLATQSGRTTGLREFQRFMGSPQRDLLNHDLAEAQGLVFERLSRSAGLKTVEGRVSPPRHGPSDLVPWILAYGKAASQGTIERFGLVIHFVKEADRRKEADRGGQRDAELGVATDLLRSGGIRRQTRQRALQLFRLLATPHPAMPFVVGIDAANLELTTPPEVFAPAFRFLREFPIALRPASSVREMVGGYPEIARLVHRRRLGMTFHVGEDFRHLLSGLRAIHEVIEFLHPRPGDRLGHALALGLDPRVWAATIGYQAVFPREEALDTLVWLHHFLGPGHELLAELSVDDLIQRYARQIYEKALDRPARTPRAREEDGGGDARPQGRGSLSPQVLYDAWRLRQLDPYSLDSEKLLEGKGETLPPIDPGEQHRRWHRIQHETLNDLDRRVGSREAFRLLHLYWFDPEVRRCGQEIEPLDMSLRGRHWMQLCDVAQEKMQRLVERRQLVVEVNPSSNRVVGPMPRLSDHPIFRLTEDEHGKPRRGIRVTINTDDPGVFNTSLAHEYYLLAENRMRQGHSEAEVIDWLEWLRKNGEDSSFVRSLPSWDHPDQVVAKLLDTLEKSYGSLPGRLSGERASAVQVVERRESAGKVERAAGDAPPLR